MLTQIIRDYAPLAARTKSDNVTAEYLEVGLLGELGELLNLYKKERWHHKPVDHDAWISELGDCLWYATMLLQANGSIGFDSGLRLAETIKVRYDNGLSPAIARTRYLMVRLSNEDQVEWLARVIANLVSVCLDREVDFALERYNPQAVLAANIDKLKARYPDGFVSYANRADAPLPEE